MIATLCNADKKEGKKSDFRINTPVGNLNMPTELISNENLHFYVNFHYTSPKYLTEDGHFTALNLGKKMVTAADYINGKSLCYLSTKPLFFFHNYKHHKILYIFFFCKTL